MPIPPLPPVPVLTKDGFADPVWAKWLNLLNRRLLAAVVAIQITTANGFSGTVVNSSGGTSISLNVGPVGVLKGSGGGLVAAVSGTDYAPATTGSGVLKGNGSGGFATAVAGTDYVSPNNPAAMTAIGIDSTGGFSSHGTAGITVTIATAKLTPGGAAGSMTFKDGLLVGQVQAT